MTNTVPATFNPGARRIEARDASCVNSRQGERFHSNSAIAGIAHINSIMGEGK